MLVLSRHRDECLMIGDDIKITVIDIRGDKVRLGIDAPSAIPVHREEVYHALQRGRKRQEAAKPPAPESVTPPSPSLQQVADDVLGEMCDE